MLNHLSWGWYTGTVLLLTIIYYVYVAWRYYRPEIRNLLGRNGPQDILSFSFEAPAEESEQLLPSEHVPEYMEDDGEATFRQIEELVAGLKAILARGISGNYTVTNLKSAVSAVLVKYPHIKNTHFRDAINEMVVTECASLGPVDLTEEEVNALWNGVD